MRIPGVDGAMSEETTTWNQDDLHLGEKFDDLVFNSTGGVFPFEAQGSYMGEPFYFRYRPNQPGETIHPGNLRSTGYKVSSLATYSGGLLSNYR